MKPTKQIVSQQNIRYGNSEAAMVLYTVSVRLSVRVCVDYELCENAFRPLFSAPS